MSKTAAIDTSALAFGHLRLRLRATQVDSAGADGAQVSRDGELDGVVVGPHPAYVRLPAGAETLIRRPMA